MTAEEWILALNMIFNVGVLFLMARASLKSYSSKPPS